MNDTLHFVTNGRGDPDGDIDAGTGLLRACPIAEEAFREKPDLCCCYIMDQKGEFVSPCHIPFENRCC